MSLREKVSKNPVPSAIVAGIIILLSILFLVYQMRAPSTALDADKLVFSKGFYSDDDGKTFYVDELKNIPPYDHNGKPAVRAILYYSPGTQTRFVSRLEKYSPADKAKIEGLIAQSKSPGEASSNLMPLIKKPAPDKNWLDITNGKMRGDYTQLLVPVSPDKKDKSILTGPLRPQAADLTATN